MGLIVADDDMDSALRKTFGLCVKCGEEADIEADIDWDAPEAPNDPYLIMIGEGRFFCATCYIRENMKRLNGKQSDVG